MIGNASPANRLGKPLAYGFLHNHSFFNRAQLPCALRQLYFELSANPDGGGAPWQARLLLTYGVVSEEPDLQRRERNRGRSVEWPACSR